MAIRRFRGDAQIQQRSRSRTKYVPADYQNDSTTEGTSVYSPATLAYEPQEDRGFADQTLGFFKGAYDVGKDADIETAELAYDVAAIGYDSVLGAPYKAVFIFSEAVTGEKVEWAGRAPDHDRGAARMEAGYNNARNLDYNNYDMTPEGFDVFFRTNSES